MHPLRKHRIQDVPTRGTEYIEMKYIEMPDICFKGGATKTVIIATGGIPIISLR